MDYTTITLSFFNEGPIMDRVMSTATPPATSRAATGGLQLGPGPWRAPVGRSGKAGAVLGFLDHLARSPLGWTVGGVALVSANALGGRSGVALASAYVLLGVAAIWPTRLPWYRAGVETVVYLAILAAGFAFERAVAARGADRSVGEADARSSEIRDHHRSERTPS
jgi:hypothetical protein